MYCFSSLVGTFYNLTGLQNVSGCLPCTAGYYCDGTGNIVPSKKCREGFWCRGGSPEEMPIDQPYGTDCPNGSYCPKGTPSPVQCPKGTYQPSRGKVRVEDCVGCDPGKFCDETGLFAVSDNCLRGYFCIGNASKSNPQDKITGDICPKGSFCVEGSFKPQTCYNGTYMNHTGLLLHWCQIEILLLITSQKLATHFLENEICFRGLDNLDVFFPTHPQTKGKLCTA